jgi:ATP-binding cassette subfamily A (ABC1) protein 2
LYSILFFYFATFFSVTEKSSTKLCKNFAIFSHCYGKIRVSVLGTFTSNTHFQEVHEVLKYIFMVFPSFCLGRGLMDIAYNHYKNEFFYGTGLYEAVRNPFQWDLINWNLVSMAIIGFVAFAVTLLLEYCRN